MDQTLFTSIVTISLALLAGFITLLQVKSNINLLQELSGLRILETY